MRSIRCPNCAEPLPLTARYCTVCGLLQSSTGQSYATEKQVNPPDTPDPDRSDAFKLPRFYSIKSEDEIPTLPLVSQEDAPTESRIRNEDIETQRISPRGKLVTISPGQWQKLAEGGSISQPLQPNDEEAGNDDDETFRRFSTWNKVVHTKTSTPAVSPITPIRPVLLSSPQPIRIPPQTPRRKPHPKALFWLSTFAILALLLGGIFGIVNVLGRSPTTQPANEQNGFSLSITPSIVALGGIITLHGTGFSPRGHIGLTRDTNIPITDTGGTHIITADDHGSFIDTVNVDPAWLSGTHIIQAENALTHKTASFTITVTGHSLSLRPPHLQLSASSVNLGSGDQATDSATTVMLANAGGGQISWQSATTQPWLLLSPNSGTFATSQNMQVTIAGDRSNLKPGTYSANVIFSSNAGQMTLHARIHVTPLEPQHEAVLQLTPGVLTFTAVDGGASPPAQIITVSNPGLQPLHWSTSSSTSDGFHWLTVAPQSGTVNKGGSQAVEISVNTATMLPGTYNARITFSNQGPDPIKDSPQTIYISLTILPQCAIQVSPGALTFTAVQQQPSPQAKSISIGLTQGCSTSLQWNAAVTAGKGGSWLSIGQKSGTTPAYPLVSASISGLSPGTYTGSIIFSSKSGNQTVPVTLIVAQPTTPVLGIGPAAMNFSGVPGQPNPPVQPATITNMGGGTLEWSASASTSIGSSWLSIAPTSGSLSGDQPANLTVSVNLLSLPPGTYNGMITVSATDGSGNPATGSPQSIPITFVVQPPCAITSTPLALNFTGIAGGSAPPPQRASIAVGGTCAHALDWTASASTSTGGPWLSASPASGIVSLSVPSSTNIGVSFATLSAGTYSGTVTITAIDGVTGQKVGTPQSIAITLTVQPACTLQPPSSSDQTYSAEVGLNPSTQTFTLGVTGTCSGNVTITPTATAGNGGNWLTVTPTSQVVTSGNTATFTVTVTSSSLSAGSYNGTISLAAVDSSGLTITGSPQQIGITTSVIAAPALTTGPGPLTFNVDTGSSYQQISIGNSGGEPLNWTATLDPNAPTFISLSATSGTGLNGGSSATINVNVDASGLQGGSTYTTSATISAIDPITGNVVTGAPATVPITINIAPPAMQLSTNNLSFTTNVGVNPDAQTITVTNTGGNSLTWTVGTPSQSWLTTSATGGSDDAGQSSPLTFSVDVTGLSSGTYTATVDVTPSSGNVVTVTVTLTIN